MSNLKEALENFNKILKNRKSSLIKPLENIDVTFNNPQKRKYGESMIKNLGARYQRSGVKVQKESVIKPKI